MPTETNLLMVEVPSEIQNLKTDMINKQYQNYDMYNASVELMVFNSTSSVYTTNHYRSHKIVSNKRLA